MNTIDRSQWKWFGNNGHFICGHLCRFHLCTQVGDFLISTVGQYLPDEGVREILAQSRGFGLQGIGDERYRSWMNRFGFEEIGCGRTFETMVFRAGAPCNQEGCKCGQPTLLTANELECDGYNDAGEATKGHYAMCDKWASHGYATERAKQIEEELASFAE